MTFLNRYLFRADPRDVLVLVGSLALLLLIFRPWQPLAAIIILAIGALVAGFNPKNGLFLTLLAAPFFLGEPQDPFIFLIEGMAGLTLVSWLIHLAAQRRIPRIPHLGWLLLAAGLILFNPPLNLKELWAALQMLDLSQILFLLGEGRKFHDLFALRSLILHLGGLMFLACCLDLLEPEDLKPLGLGLAGITAGLGVFSLLLFWGIIPVSGFYLGINLQGIADRHHQAVLATTAFNRQYFNQLLIPFLALAGGLFVWAGARGRLLAGLMVIFSLVIMGLTGQRSPFVCLMGMGLFGAGLYLWLQGRKMVRRTLAWGLAALGGLVLLALVDLGLGLDLVTGRFLGLSGTDQVTGMGLRPQVWSIVQGMFIAHPLTGLGPGTFRLFAQPFAETAGLIYPGPLQEVVGTAHNSIFHWLAELGLAGLGAVIILAFLFIRDGLMAFKDGTYRARAGVLLLALAGFTVFGLFQHIFYLSSIGLLILAGLAALGNLRASAHIPSKKGSRIWLATGLLLVLVILSIKIWAINQHNIRSPFKLGFSYGEWYDGRERWWTVGRNAAFRYWAAHPYLIIPVKNPHPIVKDRPMEVSVWAQDGTKESAPVRVILKDHEWHELKLDVREFRDLDFYVRIRTSYAFWPVRFGNTGDRRMLGVMVMDPYPADK